MDKRPWLLLSIVAAVAWYVLRDASFGEEWLVALKASGVALLAVYAVLRHPSVDARLLAGVMAASALGDALVEFDLMLGGQAFFAAHLVAIWLYLRNRRDTLAASQKATIAALLLGTPLLSYLLTFEIGVAVYGLALGAMAACAWGSRFSRYRVGLGAVLFVVSDLLIFAQAGWPNLGAVPGVVIWPLYYTGQFLIATGIIQTLRRDRVPANQPA
ncbi:MAG: lysoplasmalogenase [Alteripontixanthobacter sp.]